MYLSCLLLPAGLNKRLSRKKVWTRGIDKRNILICLNVCNDADVCVSATCRSANEPSATPTLQRPSNISCYSVGRWLLFSSLVFFPLVIFSRKEFCVIDFLASSPMSEILVNILRPDTWLGILNRFHQCQELVLIWNVFGFANSGLFKLLGIIQDCFSLHIVWGIYRPRIHKWLRFIKFFCL